MRKIEPITDPKKLEILFRQAKATAEIEGYEFTADDAKVIKAVASGEMTIEELINQLKKPPQ